MNNINVNIFDNLELEPENEPTKTGRASAWGGSFDYHWIKLGGPRHNRDITDQEKVDWCLNQFGTPGYRWFEKRNTFYFQKEQDLSMFVLRWS